jgi:hypothetical protein
MAVSISNIDEKQNEKNYWIFCCFSRESPIIQDMQSIVFITGNQKKADYLAKYLGFPIEHIKVDLDELQSLDLREIVEHKVKQAYAKI